MNEWIPVSVSPKSSGAYMGYVAYYGSEPYIEEVDYNKQRNDWVLDECQIITHWMPLPEPPDTKPHVKDVDLTEIAGLVWRACVSCGLPWQTRQAMVSFITNVLGK